jgi:hypothetical protein
VKKARFYRKPGYQVFESRSPHPRIESRARIWTLHAPVVVVAMAIHAANHGEGISSGTTTKRYHRYSQRMGTGLVGR